LLSSSSLIPLSVRTGALFPWTKTAIAGTTKKAHIPCGTCAILTSFSFWHRADLSHLCTYNLN
jgi:hypothetical protein